MSWFKHLLGAGENRIRVLAVTANEVDRFVLEGIGTRAGWDLKVTGNCQDAMASLKHRPAQVILCDRDLPQVEWREALRVFGTSAPGCAVVLISPETDDRFWLEVIEHGGYDVVTRPIHEARVSSAVRQAFSQVPRSS